MSENIGDLVVKVGLDDSNFTRGQQSLERNMRTIESTFKNATSGLKEHGRELDVLKSKQEMLSKSIDIQNKIVQRYKDKLDESKKTLNKNADAQVKLKEKVDNAKTAFEESKRSLGENDDKTKQLKKSYEDLSKEYKENEEKLRTNVRTVENYTNKTNKAEIKLKGLKHELNGTNGSIKKQTGRWNELSGKLDKVSSKFDKISHKMANIGKSMATKISAPILAGFTLAGKKAMDFGDGVAKINTIADTTKVPINNLKKGVLGLSDQFGISANEIAEAEYQALSASVDTAKVTDFLGVATKSAKGGFTDTATAVNGLTNVLNAYGYEADKAKDISNQMLITQNLGKTTFGELSKSMGKVTPIASALGMKTQELFSSLAVTTAQGLDTAESVTALKASLGNIIKPSKEASDASEALGISFKASEIKSKGWMPFLQDLSGKLRQASPELNRLFNLFCKNAHVMSTLEKQGKKNTSAYKELQKANKCIKKDMELLAKAGDSNVSAMATMFGSVEGLNSILMLTSDTGMKKYNESMQEMKTNTHAVDDAYNKMKTPGAKFRKSINKMNNVLIRFGDAITPFVEKMADGIGKITDKLNALTPAQIQQITKMAGMTAGIGLLVGGFGKLAGSISNIFKFGSKVAGFVGKFKAGETALNTLIGSVSKLGLVTKAGALLMNPWVLAVAGLGVAGYVAHKKLSEKCIPTVDLFANRVQTTANKIKDANGVITTSYTNSSVKISETTKKAVGSYMELDKKASKSLMDLNANSTKFTDKAKNTVVKNFADMVKKSGGKGKELNSKMVKEFSDLVKNTNTLTDKNKKEIISNYTSMVLDCKNLTSKQKHDTVEAFKKTFAETIGITKKQKDTLIAEYKEMGAKIDAGYDKQYKERTSKLKNFFTTTSTLTDKEQKDILSREENYYKYKKSFTSDSLKEINTIINNASKKNRQLTTEEVNKISKLQEDMKTNAIKSLSENEVEAKVILERVKSYSTSITAEQASEVIKNAEQQRIKTVDEANKQFIETKNNIEQMRDVTHSITKDQAEKMIKDAETQRDQTVKKANEQKKEVVKQISEQNSEVAKNIDTSNGEIKSKWQVLKEDVVKKAGDTWEGVKKEFNDKKADIAKKTQETTDAIAKKWDEAKKSAVTWGNNVAEGIKSGFKNLQDDMKSIGEWAIAGLKKGLEFTKELAEKAGTLAQKVTNAVKKKFDIHSPSRVMMELGKFVSEGLGIGIENNSNLAVKSAKDLADSVLKEVNKLSDTNINIKSNVTAREIKNNTSNVLNHKQDYKNFVNFVKKLNQDEINSSKELLKQEYNNRVKNLDSKLRAVKSSNTKEFQLQKANIDKQIAEYQRLSRHSKSKNSRKQYADKIANLKAYQSKVLNISKSTQQKEIANLEKSKRALKDYYKVADTLLNKHSTTIKNNLKTSENVFKSTINNFNSGIKKLSIDTDNLSVKLQHQKAIVIIQQQKIQALKSRYFELCETLGATSEQAINLKKTFEDANNEMTSMAKNVEETNTKMREKAVNDVNKLNDFIIKALERKIKAEEKTAIETAKIKAKEAKMTKEKYDSLLSYIQQIYAKKLDADNLQAQSEQMIMSKSQQAIISLLNSYGSLYEDAGVSLGQKLVMSTKSWTDVLPPIVDNCMQNVVGSVGNASNAIGNNLNGVMGQIQAVGEAGNKLAEAAGKTGGKVEFDFDFNFDSVYDKWESSFEKTSSSIVEKSKDVAKEIADKYKNALDRVELAETELNRTTKNSTEELEKQQKSVELQTEKLSTLKDKYSDMKNALGSNDDSVVQLKKDIASLTVELDNNMKSLEVNKIKSKYDDYFKDADLSNAENELEDVNNQEDKDFKKINLILNKRETLEKLKNEYKELSAVMGENADEVKNLQMKIVEAEQEQKNMGYQMGKEILNDSYKSKLEEIENEEISLSKETGNVTNEFERQDKIIENKAKKLELLKEKYNDLKTSFGDIDDETISTKKDVLSLEIEIANSRMKLQQDIQSKARADAEASASRSKQAFDDYINSIKDKYARLKDELEISTSDLARETFNADNALIVQKGLLEKQKTTLEYLKQEYTELSGALGSTSQDAMELRKSIASLNIEIENQEKSINAQAIRNKYQKDLNAIELDTLKLVKDTKNLNDELDLQGDTYMNMILKLDSMQEAYKNLSKVLGENADEVKQLEKDLISYQQEMEKFSKDCNNKIINNINKFNSKIKDALKERYNQELKLEEDKTNKELENLNKWKDESLKRIEDVYNAKIKSLDDTLKAEDRFEKDREELKKIHSLEESLKYEHNEFNKVEIQKELNRAIADRNKRLHKESIEDKKAKLQEDKKNETDSINNLYENNKANLEKKLADTKNYYKEKLKLANLEAEAEKIIISNNQKEIVKLIKSYDKDYEIAGKSLGERLADGMKAKIMPIVDLIDSIQAKIKDIRTQEIQASIDTVKYAPISSMGSGSMNSTTNNSNSTVVNNNNITFNSPKQLAPSEIRRNTETTLRNLAFSV